MLDTLSASVFGTFATATPDPIKAAKLTVSGAKNFLFFMPSILLVGAIPPLRGYIMHAGVTL